MDSLQAIATAKKYIGDVYSEEPLGKLELEEVEHSPASGLWSITIAISRPWNAPRTRAQEVLENLGALSPQQRSYKVVTLDEDGNVLSMKNHKAGAVG